MVVCRAYESHDSAGSAVGALLAAGIPGTGIRVLSGQPPRDARTEPEGRFAGETEPGDVVGDFAGGGHRHDAGSGAFAGTAGSQRGGSFADADRETVTTYPEGVERVRVASHHDVRRILRDAGLDEAAVERDTDALHRGGILVLADVGEADAAAVADLLDAQFQGSRERADQ
jgi:hypothetical protein